MDKWSFVLNKFGQRKGAVEEAREPLKVPLAERFALSPEEVSALTGIGLTSVREAISNRELKAKKRGRRTIILPPDVKTWLSALPDALPCA